MSEVKTLKQILTSIQDAPQNRRDGHVKQLYAYLKKDPPTVTDEEWLTLTDSGLRKAALLGFGIVVSAK